MGVENRPSYQCGGSQHGVTEPLQGLLTRETLDMSARGYTMLETVLGGGLDEAEPVSRV